MSLDSPEVLRHLLAISRSQIKKDIANAPRVFGPLEPTDYSNILLEKTGNRSPKEDALALHRRMVRAKAIENAKRHVAGLRLLCASVAAGNVAILSVFAAMEHGPIAELSARMEEIQAREGLTDDELELKGSGPAEYQELSRQSDKLHERIYDAMYATMLRRYDMEVFAVLYEGARAAHDQMRERGRQLIFGPRSR